MHVRRLAIVTAAALALAGASPAWAHEEISPASVPTGRPVFFTLSAANEKTVDMTKLTLAAPQGLELGHATKDPAGWTATATHTDVTWSGGAVKPDRFEQFGFEIEGADQPGTLTYKVTLGYADGTTDQADVPVVVSAASDAGAGSSTGTSKDNSGEANAALVLSLLALVAGAGALVVALRNRSSSGPGTPTPTPAAGGQDW